MASLADVKKILVDMMLGSKEFGNAAQLGAMLKPFDPDLKILTGCVNQKIIDVIKARRLALATKLTDLKETIKLAGENPTLMAIGLVVKELKASKPSKMPPQYLSRLVEARKIDVARLQKGIIQPAIEAYLKAHQNKYVFVGGTLQAKAKAAKAAKPAEPAVDPKALAKATKDTDELMTILKNQDPLFGAKSPLNQTDLTVFAKDKLSFLPTAIRGGDTKKLLSEEKLSIEAAKQFASAVAQSRGIFDSAYDTFMHNGKAYRGGGMPLLVWVDRAKFVSHRDRLVALLRNFRQHLEFWMDQRTTARLDLKSKKVIACSKLAGQVDLLIKAYMDVV